MSKLVAILIDSLYESWNSKIFVILLGLVAFFLLLVLSIGYETQGFEKGVRNLLGELVAGGSLEKLEAEQRGNFVVDIKAGLLLDDPHKYMEGLAKTRARMWLDEHGLSPGFVKLIPEPKGEGDAFHVNLKIANNFRESEILHTISVDRTSVNAVVSEDLKTMLARRQLKNVSIRFVSDVGWRKEIEITGSTSAFHVASTCKVYYFFGLWDGEIKGAGVAEIVFFIQDFLFNWIAGVFGLCLAVIACAGFTPTMLQKGSIEMWLSRPMGRATLLTYKYLGAILYILPLAVALFGGTFLILSIKTGFWNFWFLLAIPALLVGFALLQVISTFVGVLWRNQLVSIMVTLFLWFGSWGLYRIYFSTGWRELLPSWAYSTIGGLHLVSPRVSEVGNAARRIMYDGIGLSPESMQLTSIHPTSSLLEISLATIGFIAVVHALSCWIFVRRDH